MKTFCIMLYGLSVLFSHSGIPHTDAECEWFLCVWYRSVKREHREKNYIYVLFIRIKYLIFSLLFDLVSITVLFKSPVCVCVCVLSEFVCVRFVFFMIIYEWCMLFVHGIFYFESKTWPFSIYWTYRSCGVFFFLSRSSSPLSLSLSLLHSSLHSSRFFQCALAERSQCLKNHLNNNIIDENRDSIFTPFR